MAFGQTAARTSISPAGGPIRVMVVDDSMVIRGLLTRSLETDPAIKVPHMGWNDVDLPPHSAARDLIEPGEAYFLHSYHFVPDDGHDIAAMTDHGGGIIAAVARDNVVGVQFHPEKSQAYGLALLSRFLEWKP